MKSSLSNRYLKAAVVAVAAATLTSSRAQAQQTAYAIANGGTTLIRFDTGAPGSAVAIGNFNGAATSLNAIDFRPLNDTLYGYDDATDTLYTVNVTTATLTAVASGSGASATNSMLLGLDFNPLIDRTRVVTDTGQNLVYNPNSSGAPNVTTPLFYAAGDPNFGVTPRILENAYTNNVAGFFSTSLQYGIDYSLGNLVTIANNAGTLTTVGSLGVSLNPSMPFAGFDIFTTLLGVNTAYAILDTTAGTAPTLYTINLSTGAATPVGAISGFTNVRSLAVRPTAAPEPGSAALALLGLSNLLLMRRKLRR